MLNAKVRKSRAPKRTFMGGILLPHYCHIFPVLGWKERDEGKTRALCEWQFSFSCSFQFWTQYLVQCMCWPGCQNSCLVCPMQRRMKVICKLFHQWSKFLSVSSFHLSENFSGGIKNYMKRLTCFLLCGEKIGLSCLMAGRAFFHGPHFRLIDTKNLPHIVLIHPSQKLEQKGIVKWIGGECVQFEHGNMRKICGNIFDAGLQIFTCDFVTDAKMQ